MPAIQHQNVVLEMSQCPVEHLLLGGWHDVRAGPATAAPRLLEQGDSLSSRHLYQHAEGR